ncbi:MAG: molecular chaperone TorD family protein [Gemmatimonadota bacterium]|nr:molecular chaperone TorD family protein [Gemmatimonadota bacterium]
MELFRALGSLLEPPCAETRLIARVLDLGPAPDEAEYSELFLFQVYPYASVFLGENGGLGGEARDRIAGFWRALDRTPPKEPDHLATLLATYARLVEAEEGAASPEGEARWRQVRHACLWEHILSWSLPFLTKLREIAPPFYQGWVDALEAALAQESAALGPPARTPLALRESRPLGDPRVGTASDFLEALLSPVRSGVVLTRGDLARAARDLGLGLRIGERAYILRAMLSQGAGDTLGWLADEARRWERLHDASGSIAPEVADFWVERARSAAGLLADLAADPVSIARSEPAGSTA